MNDIGRHITNAIDAGKVKNAKEIATRLNVSEAAVSRWKSGARAPSAEEARALTELIGAPEGLIMAECEAARAKDDATRAAWLRVARLCSGQEKAVTTLALAVLAVASYLFAGDTQAHEMPLLLLAVIDELPIMAVLAVTAGMLLALQTTRRPPRRLAILRTS